MYHLIFNAITFILKRREACIHLCIGSIPLLGAAVLFSIVNAKRNRNKFLANVETRKGLQLV